MNRSFAHLSWAIWVNRSRSLICHEQPERFAHGRSFDLSHLSYSLTVAHLSWVIWVNRSQSLILFEWSEQMSTWANSQPWALIIFILFLSNCHASEQSWVLLPYLMGGQGLSYVKKKNKRKNMVKVCIMCFDIKPSLQ